MSFPLADFDSERSSWSSYREARSARGLESVSFGQTVDVPGGGEAFVGVQQIAGLSQHATVFGKVEFNPSRLVDADGCSICPAGEVAGLLGSVVRAAAQLVRPEDGDAAGYRVKRLDVARDFVGVSTAPALIRGLAPVLRPWARRNLVHADPKRHGAQTLWVGSGAGGVRLYDKAAESEGKAAPGTVRWESECRSEWSAKYGGIATVADVSSESVGRLAADRWEWSAMGVEVRSTSGVVDVVARSALSEREQTMFIGWLVQQGTPHAWSPSKRTAAKFRRLQRQLGVAVGPEALGSVGFMSRLDWESGTEVCRVA